MRIRHSFALFILLSLMSNVSLAGWNKTCLDDCYATGHECNYCNYECYKDDPYYIKPNYDGDSYCTSPSWAVSRCGS